jgi:hypothetical protein
MHCLYGLKMQGYNFQLKGGTSLSKGFGLIDRFSEDIDIHINPPAELNINENPKTDKAANNLKKKAFYDTLAQEISIDGIVTVERDVAFDNEKNYNSGGIRLHYISHSGSIPGLKDGILLEAGFDTVAPNMPVNISSWAFERASQVAGIDIIDNRAIDITCYDYRYTFVEKLQTIATKFRQEIKTGEEKTNFMRQYYDVYCLLGNRVVQDFVGTPEYFEHKKNRFPKEDFEIPVSKNEAFLLSDPIVRSRFQKRYETTNPLYYKSQPAFDLVLLRISEFLTRM